MRVLHFADLHIGVETYGRPLPDRGWSSRMQDFLDALDRLVDYALEEGADAVVFAGDAYKAREPSQTHQREFAKRIQRLSAAGIPVFLLVGNHDLPNAEGRAHALEIFRTLDVPHVSVGDNAWFAKHGFKPQVLCTRAGPLQIAFLPWPQVSRLLAGDAAVAGMSIDQVHRLVEQKLTALIDEQAAALDRSLPAFLACHVSVNDFLVRENQGSEQWMTVGSVPTLLKSAFREEAFDYIALGHHHNNMDLGLNTPCWYSGSMQAVDFGEEGQRKGFMVVDLDPRKPRGTRICANGPRLQDVPLRRFVTIPVKPKAADPTPEVCAAIERSGVCDAIVRVQIQLTADQLRLLRIPEARRLLESAHYVAGFQTLLPEERRSSLPPGVQPDASAPIDTLDTYLRLKETEERRRERLLAAARDLIATSEEAYV